MKTAVTANLLVVLLALACAGAVGAQQPCAKTDEDKWKQSILTYFWLGAPKGDAVVRGTPVDVDMSLSDAWDALSSLNGAATLQYEADKKKFGILFNLFYVDFENNNVATPAGEGDFGNSQTISELAALYQVANKNPGTERTQTVEVLGGLRFNRLSMDVSVPDAAIDESGSQSWVDLFIGGRLVQRLSQQWQMGVRGDIGGFGIGDSSDFTWNLVVTFEYTLSDLWGIDMGWKWLDYDYDTGSGPSEFKYDVLMQGPFVGFKYYW